MPDKLKRLKDYLRGRPFALAYSGGVDSTFLLYILADVSRGSSVAVTALSPSYPGDLLERAELYARDTGVRHIIIESGEMNNPEFVNNNGQRCYHCKYELFSEIRKIADEQGIENIIDGTTLTETFDYRPGMGAASELKVMSPLKELEWTKEEVRQCSEMLGISGYDRPQTVCFASRVPYGTSITEENLGMIARAEEYLKNLTGISEARVRSDGKSARIEVPAAYIERIAASDTREKIAAELMRIGYKFVSLDMEGFKSGKMNRLLE